MASKRLRRANKKAARARIRQGKRARRAARSGGGSIPVRAAAFGGVKSAVVRAALRSSIVRRGLSIARQRIARIPGIGRFARTTRAAQRSTAIAERQRAGNIAVGKRSLARRAARGLATAAVAGAALEAGSTVFTALGGEDVARRIAGTRGRRAPARRGSNIPFTPGTVVPTDSITHTWIANGVPFAQLADGRVMVRRKNGTIKIFRRPRPIVIGRNASVRTLVRADKKIDALLKLVRKRFPPSRRNAPKSTPTAITQVRAG